MNNNEPSILQNVFAAGVLVERDGFILAILRSDTGKYGLPFGKREFGELVQHTAIRECLEETGFVVGFPRWNHPMVSQTDTGKFAATFRAQIITRAIAWNQREGKTVWVDPSVLIKQSSYPEYNKKVFNFFKVEY